MKTRRGIAHTNIVTCSGTVRIESQILAYVRVSCVTFLPETEWNIIHRVNQVSHHMSIEQWMLHSSTEMFTQIIRFKSKAYADTSKQSISIYSRILQLKRMCLIKKYSGSIWVIFLVDIHKDYLLSLREKMRPLVSIGIAAVQQDDRP